MSIIEPEEIKVKAVENPLGSPMKRVEEEEYLDMRNILVPEQKMMKKKKTRVDMLSTPKKMIHSRFSQLTPVHESDKKSRGENDQILMTQTDCHTQSKLFESPSHLLNLSVRRSPVFENIL